MVVCLSQNLGHGDRVRVRRFYRVSVCVEAALIAVLGTVCFLFPSQIVGLFSDNGEVIAAGARYTGTMAYLYLFAYMGVSSLFVIVTPFFDCQRSIISSSPERLI